MPEELWIEICDIGQEAVIKSIPKKKKCKKAKWLSEEALHTTEKRREAKGKSVQRNRGKQQNGKIRDLLKKIRDIKGNFYAKMGTIKDRNGIFCLTEAEDIKKT